MVGGGRKGKKESREVEGEKMRQRDREAEKRGREGRREEERKRELEECLIVVYEIIRPI